MESEKSKAEGGNRVRCALNSNQEGSRTQRQKEELASRSVCDEVTGSPVVPGWGRMNLEARRAGCEGRMCDIAKGSKRCSRVCRDSCDDPAISQPLSSVTLLFPV